MAHDQVASGSIRGVGVLMPIPEIKSLRTKSFASSSQYSTSECEKMPRKGHHSF